MDGGVQGRSHSDFLCTLREAMGGSCTREGFIHGLAGCLNEAGFQPIETSLEEAEEVLDTHHGIKITKLIDLQLFRDP
jgi:hypothetical protein